MMIRLTLALLCIASPALADEWTTPPRFTITPAPPGLAHYATVDVINRIGTYNETVTLPTQHGPVSLQYTTTMPSRLNDPASADHACAVALPPGVVAVPECIDVMEEERGEMLLMLYLGG